MTQIHDLTVTEQAAAIRAGETSSAEITGYYLDRIDRLNEQVGAFYTVTHELAREQAAAADKAVLASRRDGGELPPLTGVPIPIKDLNMVAGVRLTFGSAILADNIATEDDYVVEHLRAAGIVITGKTATPEFGLPCYTETRIGPPARTPWDLTRSAGGSSGGAAAAVAAGLAPAAQGSDGGGSIRIPASVCGLFGIKPTRGRISQGPLMPDLVGLSTDGPLTRTVADAALLLDAMTGNHPGDMYTQPALPHGESFLSYAGREPGRLRIARSLTTVVPGAEVHPDCVTAYEDASALLSSLGHDVEEIDLPFSQDAVPSFLALWYAMATLAPIAPEQESELLPLTRYLRGKGLELSAADLLLHQAILQGAARPALTALNAYDAILTPTLALPPRPVGWFDEVEPAENFIRQTVFTPWTALYNLSGQPAVSVPLHWTAENLPIGVMLAGRIGDEATLISLSAQLEAARPWKNKHPPIW
ncbi:MAG TPA: amidase [Streptosporangiaceae bacterium]|nr:amidase [Streptosporangiaceae bacterium]